MEISVRQGEKSFNLNIHLGIDTTGLTYTGRIRAPDGTNTDYTDPDFTEVDATIGHVRLTPANVFTQVGVHRIEVTVTDGTKVLKSITGRIAVSPSITSP